MDIILGLLLGFFFTELERRQQNPNKRHSVSVDERKVMDHVFSVDELQQRGKT